MIGTVREERELFLMASSDQCCKGCKIRSLSARPVIAGGTHAAASARSANCDAGITGGNAILSMS
jgi:hypothetical protein